MEYILNGIQGDEQVSDKQEEYCQYIDEHIVNVKASFFKLFRNEEKPFTQFGPYSGETVAKILGYLEDKVKLHDTSKYTDQEFDGYRVKFYPTDKEKALIVEDPQYAALVESSFQLAWYNHFTHNDHHPLYWKYIEIDKQTIDGKEYTRTYRRNTPREEAYKMNPIAVLHMICDWDAMSTKFGGSVIDWYNKSAQDEKKAMHPKTREAVEQLLVQLYGGEIIPDKPSDETK